jgi:hypothetical protein
VHAANSTPFGRYARVIIPKCGLKLNKFAAGSHEAPDWRKKVDSFQTSHQVSAAGNFVRAQSKRYSIPSAAVVHFEAIGLVFRFMLCFDHLQNECTFRVWDSFAKRIGS